MRTDELCQWMSYRYSMRIFIENRKAQMAKDEAQMRETWAIHGSDGRVHTCLTYMEDMMASPDYIPF